MTRRRVDHLRREHRHCPKHGLTEWTRYESFDQQVTPRYNWRCMACANEASKALYAFRQTHPETVIRRTPNTETILAEVCTECWTVKSLTGQCYCTE